MNLRAPAIVCAMRPHGEAAAIVRLLTESHGLIAAYVAGGRGRHLRPVLIPGNLVEAELRARSQGHIPFARIELTESRGPWLGEPLASSAIGWCCALCASVLPERHAYPKVYSALAALLDAVCHAPSARGWAAALAGFEALLLRELGYGTVPGRPDLQDLRAILAFLDQTGEQIGRYLLADRRSDVMAARAILRDRLARI